MKFFTHKAQESFKSFEVARKAYWQHIEKIRKDLPPELFDLQHHYSLHDAKIISFSKLHQSDLFLILDGCRNGSLGAEDRIAFVLHFIDSKYSKRSLEAFLNRDILYVEITKGDKHRWKFSALTTRPSRNDVLTIEFNDFGYYLHDYRSGP